MAQFVRPPSHFSICPFILWRPGVSESQHTASPVSLLTNSGVSFNENWNGGGGRNMFCQSDIHSWVLLMVRRMPAPAHILEYFKPDIHTLCFTTCRFSILNVLWKKNTPLHRNLCNKCCVLTMYIWQKNVYPTKASVTYTHVPATPLKFSAFGFGA